MKIISQDPQTGPAPFFVLLAFKQKAEIDSSSVSLLDVKDLILDQSTYSFGLCFSKVFSAYYEVANDFVFKTDQNDYYKVTNAIILESAQDKIDGTEAEDHFMVLTLYACGSNDGLNVIPFSSDDLKKVESNLSLNQSTKSDEKSKFFKFVSYLENSYYYELTKRFSTEYPSIRFLSSRNTQFDISADQVAVKVLPFYWTFYYYAYLLFLRIDRSHMDMNISSSGDSRDIWVQSLMLQRKRIININRYFLTPDRTNNLELRKVLSHLSDKYQFERRMNRAKEVQENLEVYFENIHQINQEKKGRTITSVLVVLTFLGLPMSLMSIVFDSSANSLLISNPADFLSNRNLVIWLVLASVSPILIASIVWMINRSKELKLGTLKPFSIENIKSEKLKEPRDEHQKKVA